MSMHRGASLSGRFAVESLELRILLNSSLFADLNQTTSDSNPYFFSTLNDIVFMASPQGTLEPRLWASDGTAAGTVELGWLSKDVDDGPWMTQFDGGLYFVGLDAASTTQLLRTDGTVGGTVAVTDFSPTGTTITDLTPVGDVLYLAIGDWSAGPALWIHRMIDGRPFTKLVKQITPHELTPVNGIVYFTADDTVHGTELWRSDGTEAGTYLVRDITPGPSGSNVTNLSAVGGRLFFVARGSGTGTELWTSDGTEQGTMLVRDIRPGAFGSNPGRAVDVGGIAYFVAHDGTSGFELWRSDGTDAGTWRVRDIAPGSTSSSPARLTPVGQRLFFHARNPIDGRDDLWISDGTEAGTMLIEDLGDGQVTFHYSLAALAEKCVFVSDDSVHGEELWITDGSPGAATLVSDIFPGLRGSFPTELASDGQKVYFAARHPQWGIEPFWSDGQASGTRMIADVNNSIMSSKPYGFAVSSTGLYFEALLRVEQPPGAFSAVWGLMHSDGTPQGTKVLREGLDVTFPADINGRLFFSSGRYANGTVWTSDGTPPGTVPISNVEVYSLSGGQPYGAVNLNGAYVFSGRESPLASGWELWRSDGTAKGTTMIADINPGSADSRPGWMTVVDDVLFFFANAPGVGWELFRSDGTTPGTYLLKDIRPGPSSSVHTSTTDHTATYAHGGRLWFFADDGVHGKELWTSDGTTQGTTLFKDLRPGPDGSFVDFGDESSDFLAIGPTLYFVARDSFDRYGLWKSDGTEQGTIRIISNSQYRPHALTNLNGSLFFAMAGGLWTSDGTSAGTSLVRSFAFAYDPWPIQLTILGNTLFFSVESVLWRSDGTSAGSEVVRTDYTGGFAPFQGKIFFSATDPAIGEELWIATASDSTDPLVLSGDFTFEGAPQSIRIQFSEYVAHSLTAGDLILENLSTGTTIPQAQIEQSYDPMTNTAQFTFPGYPYAVLPDGKYRATLPVGSVFDPSGNPLAQYTLDFFFLNADADRDGRVNLNDFNILAANFGQSGTTFSQADFTYDGTTNLNDFNILAARFGTVLAAPARSSPFAEGGRLGESFSADHEDDFVDLIA